MSRNNCVKIISFILLALLFNKPMLMQAKDLNDIKLLTYEEYTAQLNENSNGSSMQTFNLSDSQNDPSSISELVKDKSIIKYNEEDLNYIADLSPQTLDTENAPSLFASPQVILQPVILNPNSLINGNITTDTQIAWLWDYSDPDNNALLQRYLDGFPSYYLLGMLENNIGFVTQFSDPGSFDLLYQVMDSAGELSNLVWYTIDVIPVENYQFFSGNFESVDDIKTYQTTVDYSTMNSAILSMSKTGKTNFSLEIKDEQDNVIATMSPSGNTSKRWYSLSKPSGAQTTHTYTITLTPRDYDSTFNTYSFSIGHKDAIEAMLSGPENAIWIDKFESSKYNSYVSPYTPNQDESWYRFKSIGNTVFTLLTNYSQLRFQIRDIESLEVLFDSNDPNNSSIHKNKYCNSFSNAEKARLSMTNGQDYYLVVYASSRISTQALIDTYVNMSVGEPYWNFNFETFYSRSSITGTPTTYSSTATINVTNVPRTAVISTASIRSLNGGVYPSDISYWRLKAPGQSSWRTSKNHWSMINFDYVHNSSSNININGTWQLSFIAGANSVTMIPGIYLDYYFELGD